MRYAWIRKNTAGYIPVKQGAVHPLSLIRKAYNIAFWVFLLPFLTSMKFSTGFIVFSVLIFIRLGANLYINLLKFGPEQYERFPFRTP